MSTRTARSSHQELARLLQGVEQPIYALDDERRIVFANAALGKWLGIDPAELLGRQCNYHSLPNDSNGAPDMAALLFPPPESFAGLRKSGRLTCPTGGIRSAEFLPLTNEAGDCAGLLGIVGAKELSPADEPTSVDDAAVLHEQLRQFHLAWRKRFQLARLVGGSPAIRQVREQVALAASGKANVLVIGPPGSGRKHVARTIHAIADPDGKSPLPVVACGGLSADQLESQLAMPPSPADRAALLTDIDTLPPEAQVILAKRLSSAASVRVLATSSRPLTENVAAGEFRHDLSCLLGTLTIVLPPLTRRREDVPLLAQAFLEETNATGNTQVGGFTAEALESLAAYPWPGNVGELARFVAQAHAAAEGPFVTPADLPKRVYLTSEATARPRRANEPIDLAAFLANVEKELIRRALTQAKQNKSKAAKLLGLTRPRLYRRMVQLGLIDKP